MIGDDDRLPTRDGTPSGKANERQMLDRGGMGTDGFRTDLRDNLDGTATMLRTRGGAPEFSTLPAKKKIAVSVARGFVAYAPGNSYAALFDPYTLAIENKRFQLTSVTYHVSDVADTPYLPRKWFDVWAWDKADVRINGQIAKSFFPFRFPAVQKAIPFLVPWPTPPIYGDKYRNGNLPKRMFAVGPTAVGLVTDPKWVASDVPIATLTPKAPRTERKALVCGQAIDRQKIEATMAEFFFTGQTWDDVYGGWGYSSLVAQMTTTAPFLASSSSSAVVDMARPSLANAGDSTGTMSTPITLPSTVVAVTAHGHMSIAPDYLGSKNFKGYFTYDGTISKEIPGTVDASYTRTTYTGSGAASCTQDGEALTYAATNTKLFDVRQETTSCEASTITLATGGLANIINDFLNNASNTLYWESGYNVNTVPPYRGALTMYVGRYQIPNTYCSRNHDIQTGTFSVLHELGPLVNLSFSKHHAYGPKAVYVPNTTAYDSIMGQVAGGWGMGVEGEANYEFGNCAYYKNPSGYPENFPPGAVDELNAALLEMGNAWISQTMITDASQSGINRTDFYYGSVNSSVTDLVASLSWETRDYLLLDKTNSVLIYIKGEFSASKSAPDPAPGAATLTVTLCIETPWGSASKTLYTRSYSYGTMLPENDEIAPGKYAIPSPQIRAIFTPKYREQGSFFGAAYVTKAEVANGATPACLINFVLSLETYSFIGTDETDGVVHFIPCNLIEMLYAFVFSRRYGCDPDERYPVDDAATFAAIMAGLFSVKRNIQFRDGQMVDWLIGLGLPYFGNLKTELYRV